MIYNIIKINELYNNKRNLFKKYRSKSYIKKEEYKII